MSKAVSNMLQNPWVALIGGFLLAVGARQTAPGTTWGQLLQPEQVLPMLGILGGLFLTMNARRPGTPPESPVDRAVRRLKETTAARERRRSPTLPLAVLLAVSAALATACATSTDARLVQAIEAGAVVHHETMVAAGAAAERGIITAEKLERIVAAGRDVEAALRTARAVVDLYLAAKQAGGNSSGSPNSSPAAAVADLEAALVELARVAAGVRR